MNVLIQEKNKLRRGRPKTIRYDATLKIATHAYWSQGIDGMSVNGVCRLAKVSKPSLYREFGNEDGLLSEVFKFYALGFHENLRILLNKYGSFYENLNGLVEFASYTRDQKISPKGCLGAKGFQAFDRLGEESKKELYALKCGNLAILKGWVTKSRQEITLGSEWSDGMIAEFILSMFTHGMLMNDQGKSPEKISRILSLALSPLITPK